jgi:Ca2+-binding EF-hand superfamily protein
MKALKYLSLLAVTALPVAGAFAQTPPPAQESTPAQQSTPAPDSQPAQKGASFESLDTNGDGRISKAEAAANADVSAQFSRYDQDGNGYIERAEVTTANDASREPVKP